LRGNKDTLDYLISKGGDINARDSSGHTPLHFSCNEGNIECVKSLVAKGALINAINNEIMIVLDQRIPVFVVGGRTPLHYAAEQGYADCVAFLLKQGADPSLKDLDGYTPFDLACLFKKTDVATVLNPQNNPSPYLEITKNQFQNIWNEDYTKRSKRAAVQYQDIIDGPCCFPCRYLERFLERET